MTILVTGATGLLGARLLPRLLDAGLDCRALVREGKDVPAGVAAVHGDVLDPDTLVTAVAGVTAVVHLAALFRVQDPEAIHRVNVQGTQNLIAATTAHAPHARFVMASTGLVYDGGTPLTHPAREDDPTTAIAPYPASKIEAERLLRNSGLTWSVLRLGFVYGDGDGHLQIAPKLYATLNAHPAQAVSLIHHRDIANAIELAVGGAFDGHVVNVVDEAPVTVTEIAQLLGAEHKTTAEPLTNPWRGHLDTTLARRLGFRASVATLYQAERAGIL